MGARLDWERDGPTWPNREASRFVRAAGMTWHVQRAGEGPCVLLLHGTAATTHSFRALLPALAGRFEAIACDLPGHGFTDPMARGRPTLPNVARAVGELLGALGAAPRLVVGHSAGAAIAIRMALDAIAAPAGIVGVNAALMPFSGMAGRVFSPLAKLFALNPFVPRFVSASADRTSVERLLDGTGSRLDAEGVGLYRRIIASPAHVEGAIALMAHWDLDPLVADLPRLETPVLLLVGERDKAVRPQDAHAARALMRRARVETLRGVGHVAHEEAPGLVAETVERFAAEVGASGA